MGKTLLNTLNAVHCCPSNLPDTLTLEEDVKKVQGHFRCLNVVCSKFDLDVYVNDDPHREDSCFREHKRVAFASDLVGLDFSDLELFCSVLDIPGPPDSYDILHQEEIAAELRKRITTRQSPIVKRNTP